MLTGLASCNLNPLHGSPATDSACLLDSVLPAYHICCAARLSHPPQHRLKRSSAHTGRLLMFHLLFETSSVWLCKTCMPPILPIPAEQPTNINKALGCRLHHCSLECLPWSCQLLFHTAHTQHISTLYVSCMPCSFTVGASCNPDDLSRPCRMSMQTRAFAESPP